jgi:hypothetical protein
MNTSIPTPSFPRRRESKQASANSAPALLLKLCSKYLSKVVRLNMLIVAWLPAHAGKTLAVMNREGFV